jgi:hypothetical protein
MKRRIGIVLAIALLCGGTTYALTVRYPTLQGLDFTWHWRAARALLAHQNPYEVIRATGGDYPYSSPYYYPLPAAFLALPVAWLRVDVAAAIVVAVSAGVFAFALTADGYHRLPLVLSAPMVSAVLTAQTVPLLRRRVSSLRCNGSRRSSPR